MSYACGTCGTSGLVAEAVPMGWQIKCANGHLVLPYPGMVLAWRTNALGEETPEWLASPPTIHVHRCRSDHDHSAHYYDIDGAVYLCQGVPAREVIIGTPVQP